MAFMSHVAILYGGRSWEHEVSLRSAASVLRHIDGHKIILIGIAKDGIWYLQDHPADIPELLPLRVDRARRVTVHPAEGLSVAGEPLSVDVVLPILHGGYGEDGTVQGLLEIAGLPYGGSGVLGSALSMDKDMTKRLVAAQGLPVLPWRCLTRGAAVPEDLTELGPPFFVKPARTGSSVGISRVDDMAQLDAALKEAWAYDSRVLIEKALPGAREIECAVTGCDDPEPHPLGEVKPTHVFYDYDAKYRDPDGARLRVPVELPRKMSEAIQNAAVKVYSAVQASGLARVDFLLDGKNDDFYFNEINTIPGLTSISLFPRMTAAGGLSFSSMLDSVIMDAFKEKREAVRSTP